MGREALGLDRAPGPLAAEIHLAREPFSSRDRSAHSMVRVYFYFAALSFCLMSQTDFIWAYLTPFRPRTRLEIRAASKNLSKKSSHARPVTQRYRRAVGLMRPPRLMLMLGRSPRGEPSGAAVKATSGGYIRRAGTTRLIHLFPHCCDDYLRRLPAPAHAPAPVSQRANRSCSEQSCKSGLQPVWRRGRSRSHLSVDHHCASR